MPNAFRSQKDSVIKIIICLRTITQGFSGVEDEGYIKAEFLLALAEMQQRRNIVYEWLQDILVPDKVKSLDQMSG